MKKEIGIGERRQEKKKRERERVKGDEVRGGRKCRRAKERRGGGRGKEKGRERGEMREG